MKYRSMISGLKMERDREMGRERLGLGVWREIKNGRKRLWVMGLEREIEIGGYVFKERKIER